MDKTIAIVIGGGTYNDLGIIRSCGEANIEVMLIAPASMVVPIYKSKFVSKWIDADVNDEQSLTSAIFSLVKNLDSDSKVVIFPSSDKSAIVVDRMKDSLYQCSSPGANTPLEVLMDKYVMCEMAQKAGFKVPVAERINIAQINDYKPDFPVVVKPLLSAFGQKSDISVCRSHADLEACVQKFKDHGTEQILVQTFIDGQNQKEIAVAGVSHGDGVITIGGVIEKKRMIGNGSTVYATFFPGVDDGLVNSISQYMTLTGFRGLFDIEFLKNDEGVYFIECNFRNGAYGYAITSAGLNLPQCFVEGKSYIVQTLKKTVFMEERSDILYPLRHQMSWGGWLKDLFRVDTFLWWNRRDMGPFCSYHLSKLKRVFCR